jgi:hypothetical protein
MAERKIITKFCFLSVVMIDLIYLTVMVIKNRFQHDMLKEGKQLINGMEFQWNWRQISFHYEIFVPNNSILGKEPVLIAPEPSLSRLGRDDQGVVGLMIMPGHMGIRRVIAA